MARKLEIEVTATGTETAKRHLGEVDTALGGVSSRAGTASRDMAALGQQWQKVGQGMRSVGTGLTVGVTLPIAAAATGFASLGIAAIESEDLFERSFGGMADSARAWSEDLHDRLGLNAFALREQTGLMNMMFKSMGLGEQTAFDFSTSLSQLAIDMGSAFDLSNVEAMDKIRSGMTGQTEPLQRIGILLQQNVLDEFAWRTGIAESGVALTEQQKVLARYGSLMEQTAQIQNNFADTLESPANQLKAMKETFTQLSTEVGIALMPVLIDLLGIVKGLLPYIQSAVEWFTNASPAVQKLVVGGTALVAALGPVLVVVGSIVSAIGVLIPVVTTVGATIAAVATGPIGLAVAAIAGLTTVWVVWGDDIKRIVSQTYAVVKDYLLDRFSAVVNSIKGKIEAVTGFFGDMYDAVVGHSFVPDMINGIAQEFGRLDSVMVAPTQAATGRVDATFSGLLESVNGKVEAFGSRVTSTLQSAVAGPIGSVMGQFGQQLVGAVGSLVTGGITSLINIGVNLAMQGLSKLASWVGGLFGNATKGGREDFIRQAGFSTDEQLWDTLRAAGRDDLVNTALNVIGKNDKAANAAWMREVTQVLGTQQVTGIFPTHDPGMAVGRPVPNMAMGGLVPARAGGTLVNVGEAGRPEAIVPLDRMGGMGVTLIINNDQRGAVVDERAMDRLADQMARRIPRVLQAHRVTA